MPADRLLPALLVTCGAAAQTLDLDGDGAPPALGLETAAGLRVAALDEEIRLRAAQAREVGDATVIEASMAVRDVARALLEEGDRAGAAGSAAVVAGTCLYFGRDAIDEALLSADMDILRRLRDNTAALLARPDGGAALDAWLAAALAPLATIIERAEGVTLADHWLGAAAGPRDATAGSPVALLRSVAARLDGAPLDEPGRAEARRIARYLERGLGFDEFRRRAGEYARVVLDLLALAEAVDGAAWLDVSQKAACRGRIAETLAAFGRPQSRERAAEPIARLRAAGRVITAVSALRDAARAPPRAAPGRSRSPDRPDLEPAKTAVLAAFDASPGPPAAGAGGLDLLAGALQRMRAYREIELPALNRELRIVWRKLDEEARRVERSILEAATDLAAAGGPADPALVSLVEEQARLLEDLLRLERLEPRVDAVREYAARAAGPFGGRLRQLAGRLADPGRREAAARELARTEALVDTCFPMLFEEALTRGTRPAIVATGGLQAELAGAVEAARRAWAEQWGAGDNAAAAPRLQRLRRLLEIMAESAGLLARDDRGAVLNRWAAWELDEQTLDRLVSDLNTRLKLATTAAIGADAAALEAQLQRLAAPTAALMSTLLAVLEKPLAPLPAGAAGTAGQLAAAPGPDAWLLCRRADIADLCRYTMELEHSRATGRAELADELDAWVGELATGLLEEIRR